MPVSLRSQLLWAVCLGRGVWVIAVPAPAPAVIAQSFRSVSLRPMVQSVPAWREFPACLALRFVAPPAWRRELSRVRSGGGGSCHPVNRLIW